MCKEESPSTSKLSDAKFPFLSINIDLTPAIPLCLKSDGFKDGKNLLTLFIIFVLEKELENSFNTKSRNCLLRINFITPTLHDPKSFGTAFFRLSYKVYEYGPKTGTAFGPTSHLPSLLIIQWGSKKGNSVYNGTV